MHRCPFQIPFENVPNQPIAPAWHIVPFVPPEPTDGKLLAARNRAIKANQENIHPVAAREYTTAQNLAISQLNLKLIRNLTTDDEYRNIVFHGSYLGKGQSTHSLSRKSYNLADAVTDVEMSMSNDQISQLDFTIEDPGLTFNNANLFAEGGLVSYRGIDFTISSSSTQTGSAGLGGVVVSARPGSVQRLKNRVGAYTLNEATSSDFVLMECRAARALCVVQPSSKRKTISRDVPTESNPTQGGEAPSSWTTFQRLAQDEGYWLFETYGVVFFCKPSWLFSQMVTWENKTYTTTGVYWESARSVIGKGRTPKNFNGLDGATALTSQVTNLGVRVSDDVVFHEAASVPNISVTRDQSPGLTWTVTVRKCPTRWR